MSTKVIASYRTQKNTKQADKPNEDLVSCDLNNNIFILLDGVSRDNIDGKYPNPSPAVEVVEILKHSIHQGLVSLSEYACDRITSAMLHANTRIKEYNQEHVLDFAAGAVGIVGIIEDQRFYYGYIGDCYGRIITGNRTNIFTSCQTQEIARHKKEYSADEIRHIICNNIKHPCGYGVLNGDEGARDFIRCGVIDWVNVDQIILSSDGMEDFLSNISVEELSQNTAEELIARAINYNNVSQDDRSIIKIEKEHLH